MSTKPLTVISRKPKIGSSIYITPFTSRVFMIQGFHLLLAIPRGRQAGFPHLKTDLPHLFPTITHSCLSKPDFLHMSPSSARPSWAVLEGCPPEDPQERASGNTTGNTLAHTTLKVHDLFHRMLVSYIYIYCMCNREKSVYVCACKFYPK